MLPGLRLVGSTLYGAQYVPHILFLPANFQEALLLQFWLRYAF